jgi:ubiquinone/menaquinone biosynthesis C-methylase UbiE
VLDVGCGTGLLAEHVADLAGPAGKVIGIDPLPLRIELAKRRARGNLHFQVGSAYDLGQFAEGSFDLVYLNAVFHWLPEKREPLRQFHRVLKPGGVLAFTAASKDNPFPFQAIRDRILAREPYSRYRRDPVGIVYPNTPTELAELFAQTGFTPRLVEIRPRELEPWPTAAHAIEFFEASSFGTFLGNLPDGVHQDARREVEKELELLRTPQGIVLQGSGLVAVAIRA